MGRPNRTGAYKVAAKGQVYYYAWKGAGAPRLQSKPGTRAFDAELKAALRNRTASAPLVVAPCEPTLREVTTAYLASNKFAKKAERTQSDYRKLIDAIGERFGDLPVRALHENPDATRGDFLAWRDEIGERSPRQADYHWVVLNVVLNWGKQNGKLKLNPCRDAGVEKLYEGTRRDSVWTAADVARFVEAASPEVGLGVMLAYWTGQRQGDLLALPWSAYDGDLITLTQSKGGVPVGVPVLPPLKALLDATPRKSPIMMVNEDGRPWSEHGYQHMIYMTKTRVGLRELTFHDLRGTVASDMADAGCTEAEITAVTGHKLIRNEVLGKHYLKRSIPLARAAMAKLESHRASFAKLSQPIDFIEAKKRVLQN